MTNHWIAGWVAAEAFKNGCQVREIVHTPSDEDGDGELRCTLWHPDKNGKPMYGCVILSDDFPDEPAAREIVEYEVRSVALNAKAHGHMPDDATWLAIGTRCPCCPDRVVSFIDFDAWRYRCRASDGHTAMHDLPAKIAGMSNGALEVWGRDGRQVP